MKPLLTSPFLHRSLATASALVLIAVLPAKAQPILGECLNVGPAPGTSANSVNPLYFSGAVGTHNNVSAAMYSLAVGADNTILTDFSVAMGAANNVNSERGGAFGESNTTGGSYNYAFGLYNEVNGAANLASGGWIHLDEYCDGSAVFGVDIQAHGLTESLVSGMGHILNGVANSAAIGYGLTLVGASSRLVTGQFNLGDEIDALFVVGNGTGTPSDPNERRNAFTVFANGDVRIPKPQGDILMGEFGSP